MPCKAKSLISQTTSIKLSTILPSSKHLWSSGYDSRLGLSKDIKCERSQVRVLASARSFAFCCFKISWRCLFWSSGAAVRGSVDANASGLLQSYFWARNTDWKISRCHERKRCRQRLAFERFIMFRSIDGRRQAEI